MAEFLDDILQAQKRGEIRGIPSICSAHPWVLKTSLQGESPVLIEATCNQVNQFGGYTGMTPAGFKSFVSHLTDENRFPQDKLILGGDHLGPSPWQDLPAETAMDHAIELVHDYVRAGFTKIHLDTSMHLDGDNPASPLDLELAARRTALLAKTAETSAGSERHHIRYVIGTEVPIPGGARVQEPSLEVTKVGQARETLLAVQEAFKSEGLDSAWERVTALVVQPGVEFGSDHIHEYDPNAASDLVHFSESIPMIYEAHSTDYQTPQSLRNLVRDHFAILKVGPALTFAFREAVFALAAMENELFPPEQCSHIIEVMETAMLEDPKDWKNHYHGTEQEMSLARKFSFSDRIRYYWARPAPQKALAQLLHNFDETPIPLTLASQYLHHLYMQIIAGTIRNSAASILSESIQTVVQEYAHACRPIDD